MRLGFLVVASLALCGEAAAQAEPSMTDAGLVWKRPPSIADLAKWYPLGAGGAGVRYGSAKLDCTAASSGKLNCAVVEQWPEPWKFGRSALAVIRPTTVRTVDGGSPEGRRFTYGFKFGRWPAAQITKSPAPGLVWRIQPALNLQSVAAVPDQPADAAAECRTEADGGLACALLSNSGDQAFGNAVLRGLSLSKVEATDGQLLEGRTFVHVARYRRAR